jgi:hypothetical protein
MASLFVGRSQGPLKSETLETGYAYQSRSARRSPAPPTRRGRERGTLLLVRGEVHRLCEIVASDLTGCRTPDCAQVPVLLGQIAHRVASVSADGAYDAQGVFVADQEKGGGQAVRVLIPPGRNAQLRPRAPVAPKERDRNVRSIEDLVDGNGVIFLSGAGGLSSVPSHAPMPHVDNSR